ncbi:MAG: hypothetical protein H6865_00210 [Rhodospirillales bacterium]|nr:hypothetical protein [Alphaproteobacteria bacterium]MCB9986048.1 hypothetical protein [Rhodospirillales bacterium]USO07381.1 MAG: hypothetical protein H6866_08160 [Rhodospirillales bacterium]
MTLTCAIEPATDLELYLGYARPAGAYAGFAEIRRKIAAAAPHFDFAAALTGENGRIMAVRDAARRVRAMAVVAGRALRLYYADDPAATRALMRFIDERSEGNDQPAPTA